MSALVDAADALLSSLSDAPMKDSVAAIGEKHPLSEKDRQRLIQEIEGLGPIEDFLDDPEVSEILIHGPQDIFVEKKGQLCKVSVCFISDRTFMRFINNIFNILDKMGSARHPLIEGMLNSQTRVHITLPPVTAQASVCLRKHTFSQMTLNDLEKFEMITPQQKYILQSWILNRKNVLISGATGTGKTTLLRSLIHLIPPNERVVLMEDTSELGPLPFPSVNTKTRIDPEGVVPDITLSTLVKTSLRMRPDRLVVGEVRGEEALYLIDAMATGHRGSLGTIHAGSPHESLRRLHHLISRAAPQWKEQTIRQLIRDAFDGLVHLERTNGHRRIASMAEIAGLEDFGFLLNEV